MSDNREQEVPASQEYQRENWLALFLQTHPDLAEPMRDMPAQHVPQMQISPPDIFESRSDGTPSSYHPFEGDFHIGVEPAVDMSFGRALEYGGSGPTDRPSSYSNMGRAQLPTIHPSAENRRAALFPDASIVLPDVTGSGYGYHGVPTSVAGTGADESFPSSYGPPPARRLTAHTSSYSTPRGLRPPRSMGVSNPMRLTNFRGNSSSANPPRDLHRHLGVDTAPSPLKPSSESGTDHRGKKSGKSGRPKLVKVVEVDDFVPFTSPAGFFRSKMDELAALQTAAHNVPDFPIHDSGRVDLVQAIVDAMRNVDSAMDAPSLRDGRVIEAQAVQAFRNEVYSDRQLYHAAWELLYVTAAAQGGINVLPRHTSATIKHRGYSTFADRFNDLLITLTTSKAACKGILAEYALNIIAANPPNVLRSKASNQVLNNRRGVEVKLGKGVLETKEKVLHGDQIVTVDSDGEEIGGLRRFAPSSRRRRQNPATRGMYTSSSQGDAASPRLVRQSRARMQPSLPAFQEEGSGDEENREEMRAPPANRKTAAKRPRDDAEEGEEEAPAPVKKPRTVATPRTKRNSA